MIAKVIKLSANDIKGQGESGFMIIILKHGVTEDKMDQLIRWIKSQGLGVDVSKGEFQTILGLIGDVLSIDTDMIESLDIVQATRRVTEPFKRCNRKFQPEDSIVSAGDFKIGGGHFGVFAGPSSLENEEQAITTATKLKQAGASVLTGGTVNPRVTSYIIRETVLREIELLKAAKRETGMPIAKEILSVEDVPAYDDVDILIVGQRNMTNYPLLAELGEMRKPVILRRSVSATLEELLMAADYIMTGGNKDIILCERGIKTFSDYTKSTLDIAAVPLLKELSHLPVIADASRSTGLGRLAGPVSKAICAAGADGLILDVHNDPSHAASNSMQAVSDEAFTSIIKEVLEIREVIK